MSKLTFLPADSITEEDMDEVIQKISVEDQILREREYQKEQGLRGYGIINDLNYNEVPDKLIYSDGVMYAFVYDRNDNGDDEVKGYGLWACTVGSMHLDDFTEVSDLTEVAVFTYQKLRKIAIAIGWIDDSDRFWLI